MKKERDQSNMCGINLGLARIKNFMKKIETLSNMCGINLRLAKITNFVKKKKERDQSNM